MRINERMTPRGILRELYYENIDWHENMFDILTYVKFKKFMMYTEPVHTTELRRCREKWNELIDFGFFYKTNKLSVRVDLQAVRRAIGVPELKINDNEETGRTSTQVTFTNKAPEGKQ